VPDRGARNCSLDRPCRHDRTQALDEVNPHVVLDGRGSRSKLFFRSKDFVLVPRPPLIPPPLWNGSLGSLVKNFDVFLLFFRPYQNLPSKASSPPRFLGAPCVEFQVSVVCVDVDPLAFFISKIPSFRAGHVGFSVTFCQPSRPNPSSRAVTGVCARLLYSNNHLWHRSKRGVQLYPPRHNFFSAPTSSLPTFLGTLFSCRSSVFRTQLFHLSRATRF